MTQTQTYYDYAYQQPGYVTYNRREYKIKYSAKGYSNNIEARENYGVSAEGTYFISHYNASDRNKDKRKIPLPLFKPTNDSDWNELFRPEDYRKVKIPLWFSLNSNDHFIIKTYVPNIMLLPEEKINNILNIYISCKNLASPDGYLEGPSLEGRFWWAINEDNEKHQ